MHRSSFGLTKAMLGQALAASFAKLDPRKEIHSPVMFVVWSGTSLSTVLALAEWATGRPPSGFTLQVLLWLWFTLLFANFAESVAEIQGRAKADSLRRMRASVTAKVRGRDGSLQDRASSDLRVGDLVVCGPGDLIPGDGEVVEGIASVDESAITGESAPVIREAGGDRSGVTGGTRVISDSIVVRITANPGDTFIDRMILMVEGSTRQKTPGELALTILLASLSAIFLLATVTLYPFAGFVASQSGVPNTLSLLTLTALLTCLIPTTIGGLLSAIGISGVSRLMQRNVMALSGRAIEAAGDLDTLLLDKTGTITYGNRRATALVCRQDLPETAVARLALEASMADLTPEGRSIVRHVAETYGLVPTAADPVEAGLSVIPFTASTRMSGVDHHRGDGSVDPGRSVRKGAVDAIKAHVEALGGRFPADLAAAAEAISRAGGTPLAIAAGAEVVGLVHLKDVVKEGIKERLAGLHALGIRTVMVTGDNRLTAASIAAEAGVSDFVAEAKPEDKLEVIRQEQAAGHLVAMIGDGTNDAPALAQADVGVAMASGTQTAREAGNMIDFDNHPAKVLDVVEVGKQLLVTRGALTTFSIANDVSKYFAILPAVFAGYYALPGQFRGPLEALNIMGLGSPESAILSAVIFNALIIVALIPLALRGTPFTPSRGAGALLRRNLLVYGLGGLLIPFGGIKAIDLVVRALGLA